MRDLTRHRPKRRKVVPYTQPLAAARVPHGVWCADFKGWFRPQDGERIAPLTISGAPARTAATITGISGEVLGANFPE